MTTETVHERREIEDPDCVRLFNSLIVLCDVNIPRIKHSNSIDFLAVSQIFKAIFRKRLNLPDLNYELTSEEEKFQVLVDFLASNILSVSLEHIQAKNLINKEPATLYNLLEILAACELYLPFNDEKKDVKDEEVQVTATLLSSLSLSSSSSSTSTSSFSSPLTTSNLSLSSTTSSSSFLSIASKSSQSSPRLTPRNKISTPERLTPLIASSQSPDYIFPSSPDSACICHKVRDIGVNTLPMKLYTQPVSEKRTKHKSKAIKVNRATSPTPGPSKTHNSSTTNKNNFESIEEIASHRFALEIGYRLQRALKLEEATKQIERKISAITGELVVENYPTKRKKLLSKIKHKPRHTINQKNISKASFRSNILTKPIVCSDKAQKILTSRLLEPKKKVTTKLKIAEDGKTILEEWHRQNAALAQLHADLRQQDSSNLRNKKLQEIQERAIKREARTERARVHNLVSSLEKRTCSKYLAAQAKEENLLKSQAQEKLKSFKDDILYYKKQVKDQLEKEEEKRKRLLDAFQHYYQTQLSMMKEKIDQEEKNLSQRYNHKITIYEKLRKELKSNLEKEIAKLVSDK